MLDALKELFADFAGGAKHPDRFDQNDFRLAAAALLLHVCTIDGETKDTERHKVHDLLKSRFSLDDRATDELIAAATEAEGEAVDLYGFTSLLNRALDQEGRIRLVDMMWEVVFADGQVNEFEDNVIWRAADLLGVSSRERIEARRRVAAEQTEAERR